MSTTRAAYPGGLCSRTVGGGVGWVFRAAGVAVLSGTTVAWAQKPASVPDEDSGILQYVVAALILLVISATGFLKANRSHRA